jgi:pimeloyl-ACP methyl ester carboxylesterase
MRSLKSKLLWLGLVGMLLFSMMLTTYAQSENTTSENFARKSATPENIAESGMVSATEVAAPAFASDRLKRREFFVKGDPGIQLFVREVKAKQASAQPKPPVLLLHGARVPGLASFDLNVAGGSLAADLALAGHAVYIMDARGYGGSTRPAEMSQPPAANPPLVRSGEVVRDIAAVVEVVRQQNGGAKVALLGWATGGHWFGQYATIYPDRVSHLILYNTLYGGTTGHPTLGSGTSYEDPQRPGRFNVAEFGAYRLNTGASLLPSWDRSIPVEDKTLWRDPAVADAYVQAALASDSTSQSRQPASFRAPSGASEYSFYLATGRQLWDASLIKSPTLVIASERDFWSQPADRQRLLEHLTSASRVESVVIPDATHYVHLDRPERGRDQFVKATLDFLSK